MGLHNLPLKFIYYNNSSFIAFRQSPIAEISVQQSEGIYELSQSTTTDEYKLTTSRAITVPTIKVLIKLKKGGVVSKYIYFYPYLVQNITTGEEMFLITFSTPSRIFGPRVLKLDSILEPHNISELPVAL